jgi:hypothetical protein
VLGIDGDDVAVSEVETDDVAVVLEGGAVGQVVDVSLVDAVRNDIVKLILHR